MQKYYSEKHIAKFIYSFHKKHDICAITQLQNARKTYYFR